MDDKLKVRKHFVFLLNFALDLQKKNPVSENDLIAFSNKVRCFNELIEISNINNSLKSKLKQVYFKYSPNRADVSSTIFIIIATIFTMFFASCKYCSEKECLALF